MDVKEAVRSAKRWVLDVMDDEHPANLGLEEVEYNDKEQLWKITLGFSRAWNSSRGALASISAKPQKRAYRTILVDDRSGEIKGMQLRMAPED
jgi:hypothetical protein